LLAIAVSGALFSILLLVKSKSPTTFFELLWRGGFGDGFALQNTLERASPLIFAALCVAIPARLGMVVIAEAPLVFGGLAAGVAALPFLHSLPPAFILGIMTFAAVLAGAACIGFVGALRAYRGVNETISSLLLSYIVIAILNFLVEGPLRDPASTTKPSTRPIGAENMIGMIPGTEVHWGIIIAFGLCAAAHLLIYRTTGGFAARVIGGNIRAALAQGLPVARLTTGFCMVAGACAGLAGFFEVAAIHGQANSSLAVGFGFSAVLVSFMARHDPLAIPVVAIAMGGIQAAGGLIQRHMHLPDASVQLLQGMLFVVLLASETLYGRVRTGHAVRRARNEKNSDSGPPAPTTHLREKTA
jgi:simple sugar transport system permease protein